MKTFPLFGPSNASLTCTFNFHQALKTVNSCTVEDWYWCATWGFFWRILIDCCTVSLTLQSTIRYRDYCTVLHSWHTRDYHTASRLPYCIVDTQPSTILYRPHAHPTVLCYLFLPVFTGISDDGAWQTIAVQALHTESLRWWSLLS